MFVVQVLVEGTAGGVEDAGKEEDGEQEVEDLSTKCLARVVNSTAEVVSITSEISLVKLKSL